MLSLFFLTILLPIAALLISPVSLHAQSDFTTRDFPLPISPPHQPSPSAGNPATGAPADPPLRPRGAPRIAPAFSSSGTGIAQLAQAAGRIFSGTVTAISAHTASGQGMETVFITFHVEQAIRGVTAGENVTISQWMGAWSSGQRYRVGERVLLFLYPPSKLGLTSCVGGSLGRFTVDSMGRVQLSAQHHSAFRADPILSGKSWASLSDFALAIELARARAEAQE